jgi:predicted nucleotidyltransferase
MRGLDTNALIQDLAPRFVAEFGDSLLSLALFGSRARGQARGDSDIDVHAVIRDLEADPFVRSRRLARALPDQVALSINVVARTPQQFEATVTTLHLELAVDAVILWERERYLSERLAVVRERLREAGLWRGDDLVWRWRRAPAGIDWSVDWGGVRL